MPLAIAFTLGRRAANRRYTYGYGRAVDLAGLVVVLLIALSAVAAGWEAIRRLLDPQEVTSLPLVALAGLIGFIGNEWVARYRIRVGCKTGPPPWSQTDCTPAPTASPASRCCSAPAAWPSGFPPRTRSWGC